MSLQFVYDMLILIQIGFREVKKNLTHFFSRCLMLSVRVCVFCAHVNAQIKKETVIKINRTSIICYLCHCKCFCRLLSIYTVHIFGLFVWHNSSIKFNPKSSFSPVYFHINMCCVHYLWHIISVQTTVRGRARGKEVESTYIENKFDWKNESIE